MNRLNPELYTIAWIAPLEIEARAALLLLDKRHHGRFALAPGDDYIYEAGEICDHNVIIATLPSGQEYGTGAAAAIAAQVKKFFPRLWLGLLVGVAAGLPNLQRDPPLDIRLGDVLVGMAEGDNAGLIAYDLGKETANGFQPLRCGHVLAQTETLIRSAIGNIKLHAPDDAGEFLPYYEHFQDKRHSQGSFADPGQENDVLYEVDDQGRERLVSRELRPQSNRTRVWYGPIGSGDKLLKNADKRNELRDRYNVIGLEMEAAGTMNRIPVGVIRGVCDYGDERKNMQWQPYAAAMAAAYAKAVLARIPPKVVVQLDGQFMDTGVAGSVPGRPKRLLDDTSPSTMNSRAKSPRLDDPGTRLSQNLDDDVLPSGLPNQDLNAEPPFLDKQQRQALLDSLAFDQIDSRHDSIEKAYKDTCTWLSKTSEYLDWLDPKKLHEHHGFLWVKGNPGAGKSTLMKSALLNAQKTTKSSFISFFFNARGDDLEKSTIGMYRSLLLQLLEKVPRLQLVFNSLGRRARNGNIPQWSIGLLKTLFEQAIQNLEQSPLTCFIDALDECDDSDIRDMISFFEAVGEIAVSKGILFRVCLSSRYYPHITIAKGLTLHLGQQEGHDQDIVSYVNGKLRIGGSTRAKQIRSQLIEKASGIFIWVVLVVQILSEDFDHGHLKTLSQRLEDIPKDLNELFRDILTRDNRHQDELVLCIQWVLFAREPLRQEQLYVAILIGVDTTAASNWDPDEVGHDDVKRFILSSSKGLVEVNTSKKSPKVQFIHESVREFFLKEGLARIWPDLKRDFRGQSHERLKRCCLEYMSAGAAGLPLELSVKKSEQEKQRHSAERAFPLLEYAFRNTFYHADEAAASGISQTSFLQNFDLASWLKLEGQVEKHVVRRHSPTTSLLYILAEYNAARLIDCHPNKLSGFKVEKGNERYGMPILAAVATNSRKSVHALLKAQADDEPSTSPLHDLCEQYHLSKDEQRGVGRTFNFSRLRSPLINIVEAGDHRIVAFAAASTKIVGNTDWKGREIGLELLEAAKRGHETTVRSLLKRGANIEAVTRAGETVLHLAAERATTGTAVMLQFLLDQGANIEAVTNTGETALHLAVKYGDAATVQLLLDKGVNIEASANGGSTALHLAAKHGNTATVQLLLDNGANIEAEVNPGETPLHRATQRGDTAIIQLLLDNSANIEATTQHDGETALHLAIERGDTAILQLLLDNGANIEATGQYDGETALHRATQRRDTAIMQLLLEKGANIEALKYNNETALHLAVQSGRLAIIQLLLEKGANIEAISWCRETALHLATKSGSIAIVHLLLKKGANLEAASMPRGETALHQAAERGYIGIVKLLLEEGANIEAATSDCVTALHMAALSGSTAIVQLLLNKGANIKAVTKDGLIALDYASRSRKTNVVSLLCLLEESRPRGSI